MQLVNRCKWVRVTGTPLRYPVTPKHTASSLEQNGQNWAKYAYCLSISVDILSAGGWWRAGFLGRFGWHAVYGRFRGWRGDESVGHLLDLSPIRIWVLCWLDSLNFLGPFHQAWAVGMPLIDWSLHKKGQSVGQWQADVISSCQSVDWNIVSEC